MPGSWLPRLPDDATGPDVYVRRVLGKEAQPEGEALMPLWLKILIVATLVVLTLVLVV